MKPSLFNANPSCNWYLKISTYLLSFIFLHSCECKPKGVGADKSGILSLTADKTNLNDKEHSFVLTLQLDSNDKNKEIVAEVKNFKIDAKLEATGGTPGSSELVFTCYDEAGKGSATSHPDGSSLTQPAFYFFKTSKEGIIEYKEQATSHFSLKPGPGVNVLKVNF